MKNIDLSGKAALVTGAKQGIGKTIAQTLAECGADVAVLDLSIGAGDEVARAVTACGVKCLTLSCDVSDEASVQAAFEQIEATFGRLDILANNAGITLDAMSRKMSVEQFRKVLDINLVGSFLCARQAMALMKETGGSIINFSSIAGVMGNMGQANYASSKAGILGLTKTLALEGARNQIRVNAVVPGFIDTPMTAAMPEDIKKMAIEKIPLKRMGTTADIADAVLFLGSKLSSFITGQALQINGGRYM